VVSEVFEYHKKLVAAISDQSAERAADIMHKMLSHGEERLRKIIAR
jgi:DNA-binding FadR family transcriptional regulator